MATATARRPPQTSSYEDSGNDAEICAGCGVSAPDKDSVVGGRLIPAGKHPWVGIGHPEPTKGTTPEGEEGLDAADMVSHPVCDACHRDPAHRTVGALKVHFFPRESRKLALMAAQAQIMREDPS